jgi:hypothetical protein
MNEPVRIDVAPAEGASDALGMTMGIADDPLGVTLPFTGSGDIAGMTVASYAAFRAVLDTSPEMTGVTQAAYGVPNDRARRTLDETWEERFRQDPEAHALWQVLHGQFAAWLARHGQQA